MPLFLSMGRLRNKQAPVGAKKKDILCTEESDLTHEDSGPGKGVIKLPACLHTSTSHSYQWVVGD